MIELDLCLLAQEDSELIQFLFMIIVMAVAGLGSLFKSRTQNKRSSGPQQQRKSPPSPSQDPFGGNAAPERPVPSRSPRGEEMADDDPSLLDDEAEIYDGPEIPWENETERPYPPRVETEKPAAPVGQIVDALESPVGDMPAVTASPLRGLKMQGLEHRPEELSRSSSLKALFPDVDALRRAVILKELLDQPLASRRDHAGF